MRDEYVRERSFTTSVYVYKLNVFLVGSNVFLVVCSQNNLDNIGLYPNLLNVACFIHMGTQNNPNVACFYENRCPKWWHSRR